MTPSFVRRAPSEAQQLAVPGSKRRERNWLATLQRGEQVRVLAAEGGWLQVQSSDETTGWVKREGVLLGPQLGQATNLAPLRRFGRPDFLALVADAEVPAGSLLYVLRDKDGFCLVNYSGTATTWVLTDALLRTPRDVEAAKLLHRARQLAERHDAAAEPMLALAKSRYADSQLIMTLFAPPPPVPLPPDDLGAHPGEVPAGMLPDGYGQLTPGSPHDVVITPSATPPTPAQGQNALPDAVPGAAQPAVPDVADDDDADDGSTPNDPRWPSAG